MEKSDKAKEEEGNETAEGDDTAVPRQAPLLTEEEQLLLEIRERREFLDAMASLGQGGKHARQMEHEIALVTFFFFASLGEKSFRQPRCSMTLTNDM